MVRNFFKNGARILAFRQTDILSAASVIMLMSLASAILGLVRNRLLAHYFTPDLVGIYFAAFRLPDFIFQVLILGALSVAFIPIFSEYWQMDKNEAWRLTATLLNLAIILFIFVIVLILIFLKPVSLLIVPGLEKENPAHLALLLNLTRIILLTQIFFVFSAFLTGILQSFQRFLFPALAAVFYNLGIIMGLVLLAPLGMYGVALGVIIGAIMHFLIQLPLVLSLGFRPKFVLDFWHPGVLAVGRMMFPRSLALAATQLNFIVNTSLASLISLASITFLNFAQQLVFVPINFFGAAIAQAAFPTLSQVKNQEKIEEFKDVLLSCLGQILFLTVPVATAFLILHTPLTRFFFGAKGFSWESTILTGRTLAFFSLGLFAQSASFLLIRGFYALQDTSTPLKIGAVSTLLNILLSLLLVVIFNLPVWGLGISTSVGAIFNLTFLLLFLEKRVGKLDRARLFKPLGKICLAALGAALFFYLPVRYLDQTVLDTTRTVNLILLLLISGISGGSFYLLLASFLKVEEVKIFFSLMEKIGNWRKILAQSPEVIEEGGAR